jgi:pyruvate formate lyase activating enzyme
MKEAMFYGKGLPGRVNCNLCGVRCRNIPEGSTGFCRVRKNLGGKLYSLVYGKACSAAVDPIEKKPLFHFAPGTQCLSVATVGCNFRCLHCQNWEISQEFGEISGRETSPEELVGIAKAQGAQGIAYTYTEPTVFYEYAYDTMKLAKKAGLYNVWVSNGYTMPQAIRKAAKYMDAVNVDLKGDDDFYRNVCIAKGVKPVYDALLEYKRRKVWTEITMLVIEGYNYNEAEISGMAKWIKDKLGADTPLHFTAFYPHHKLRNAPPTKLQTLLRCKELAKEQGLRWIYIGNVPLGGHENTKCPECGELVIGRDGFRVLSYSDRCGKCGTKIPIAGKRWL